MKRLMMVLPAMAVLAACNSKTSVQAENASVAEVAAATKDAVKLEPGKWETTVKILSIEGPGITPATAGAMKQQTQKAETCLTPEQAAKPPQDMLGAAKNCMYEKYEMGGGTMSGTLVCKGMPGMPAGEMRTSMSGKFASTSYELTSETTVNMPGGPTGNGKMTSKSQVTGKRLGACDATAG